MISLWRGSSSCFGTAGQQGGAGGAGFLTLFLLQAVTDVLCEGEKGGRISSLTGYLEKIGFPVVRNQAR